MRVSLGACHAHAGGGAYQGIRRDGLAFGNLVFMVLMRMSSRDKQSENGGGLDALA